MFQCPFDKHPTVLNYLLTNPVFSENCEYNRTKCEHISLTRQWVDTPRAQSSTILQTEPSRQQVCEEQKKVQACKANTVRCHTVASSQHSHMKRRRVSLQRCRWRRSSASLQRTTTRRSATSSSSEYLLIARDTHSVLSVF